MFLHHFTKGLIEHGNRVAPRDHSPPRKRKKTLPILDDRVFSSLRVRHGGFEPSTIGLEVRCSIQLS